MAVVRLLLICEFVYCIYTSMCLHDWVAVTGFKTDEWLEGLIVILSPEWFFQHLPCFAPLWMCHDWLCQLMLTAVPLSLALLINIKLWQQQSNDSDFWLTPARCGRAAECFTCLTAQWRRLLSHSNVTFRALAESCGLAFVLEQSDEQTRFLQGSRQSVKRKLHTSQYSVE